MGGTNFWGGSEADSSFLAPSFDDRILEVVAVYDVMQMAASRVVHIRHHRIAQCHSVKITILGDDPLPVQVHTSVNRVLYVPIIQMSLFHNLFPIIMHRLTAKRGSRRPVLSKSCTKTGSK